MRRLIPLVVVLLSTSSMAYAAPRHTPSARTVLSSLVARTLTDMKHSTARTSSASLRRLHSRALRLSRAGGAGYGRGRTATGATRARSAAADLRPNTSASQLALPDSLVSAGNGTQGAISSGQGPFSNYHKNWGGFQSGVAAVMNFEPIMDLFYQGSVFSDANSAQLYATESFTLTESWSTTSSTDCSNAFGVPCKITSFVATDGSFVLYSFAIVNSCVIEAGYQGDPNLISQNSSTVSGALAAVQTTGVQEAQSACSNAAPAPQPSPQPQPQPQPLPQPQPQPQPQPSPTTQVVFHLIKVQFAKATTHPGQSDRALKKAKAGSKVTLEGFLEVDSAPAGLPLTVTLKVTRGGHVVAKGSVSGNLDSSPTGVYPLGETWKIPKKLTPGRYTGTISVSMSGQAASASGHLNVLKAH